MFIEDKHPETASIKEKQTKLDNACLKVQSCAQERLKKLKVERVARVK